MSRGLCHISALSASSRNVLCCVLEASVSDLHAEVSAPRQSSRRELLHGGRCLSPSAERPNKHTTIKPESTQCKVEQ